MDRLSNFVLAHRRWVFVFWLGMFLVGMVAAGRVPDRLSYNFALPGQRGTRQSRSSWPPTRARTPRWRTSRS